MLDPVEPDLVQRCTNSGNRDQTQLQLISAGPVPIEFIGIHDRYAESGQPQELLEKYGLSPRAIAAAAKQALRRKRG